MPQETWFVHDFVILIDDLNIITATYKFFDDVTVAELTYQSNISWLQLLADQATDWYHQNFMSVNIKKTKDLFGRIFENPPFRVTFNTGAVDRVTLFKLLLLIITDNLSCENHVNAVNAKAGTRLHFPKLLKRS